MEDESGIRNFDVSFVDLHVAIVGVEIRLGSNRCC